MSPILQMRNMRPDTPQEDRGPDVEHNLPKLAEQVLLIRCSTLCTQNYALARAVLSCGGLSPALPFERGVGGRRFVPPPPHSPPTRQQLPTPVSPGVLHSDGWQGSKQS